MMTQNDYVDTTIHFTSIYEYNYQNKTKLTKKKEKERNTTISTPFKT